mmetsp:Transcript_10785/g.21095  ORF Transcript_10785/g.21095 Transcript_10785/m.21095 type:complete len:395 (-) Transcript_10785:5421-6605(-)
MQESEQPLELNSIPLPEKIIFDFSGHVLPNALAFGNYKNVMMVAAGATNGVLKVFTGLKLKARMTVKELGIISIVEFVNMPYGNCIMTCSLEGKCSIINLEHLDLPEELCEEVTPENSSMLVPNINCIIVDDLDADLKLELMASTTDGIIAFYKYAEGFVWAPIKQFSLSYNVINLSLLKIDNKPLILMSDNEGNFRTMQMGIETPERAQARNILTERVGVQYGYTLLSTGGETNSLAAVNSQGKVVYYKSLTFDARNLEGPITLDVKIERMPVFIDKIRFNQDRDEVIVVGTSDGCVIFLSPDGISNLYRYEETVQAFKVGRYTFGDTDATVLAIVANCGKLVMFQNIKFLDNKLGDFTLKAYEDLEALRKLLNDSSSSTADLLRKYLYMPLG